jgi:peptide/nickel transport system permease protein
VKRKATNPNETTANLGQRLLLATVFVFVLSEALGGAIRYATALAGQAPLVYVPKALLGMALVLALAVAIPLGTWSAYKAGSTTDRSITGATFGLLAVPNFMMAILLILVFAETLGWLPATGWTRLTDDPLENLRSALLPALSLAIGELAVFTRLLRSDMISTLQQDSITMARAKGISPARILFRHALRPSSFSLMTVVGIQVGAIISGSVIVETLFAVPGVGRLLVDSILQRDLQVVQGVALVVAASFVVINGVVDVFYSLLDPRIRHGRVATA